MLGIEWDKFKDTFIIDLHKMFTNGFNSPVTRRNVLRLIASIYDRLGIISPIVVLFKIYFQKLTTLKNNWDTDLIETMFLQYKNKRRGKEKHLETRLQRKHM